MARPKKVKDPQEIAEPKKPRTRKSAKADEATQAAPEAVAAAEPQEEVEKALCPDCCRRKERSPEEYRDLIIRLNRIEGQVRGIHKMVENDAYCIDILVQTAAVNAALHNFTRELLGQHISTCVADELKEGKEEKLDELLHYLPKFMQ